MTKCRSASLSGNIVFMERPGNLTISLLSEYLYCPRSFIYRYFDFKPLENNNLYIADGRIAHVKSDSGQEIFDRTGRRVRPRFSVHSKKMCVSGVVDRVIFDSDSRIIAIEEKRGRIRENKQIEMQLALELYCLKEMYPLSNVTGSIYFSDSRRHKTIDYDSEVVEQFINEVRSSLQSGVDGFPPVLDSRCEGCMYGLICGAV